MLRVLGTCLLPKFKSDFPKFAIDAVFSKSKFVKLSINAVFLKPELVEL